MATMSEYTQARDGNLYVGDTRITVESVLATWWPDGTVDEILRAFPGLTREQVEGVLAYYREHPDEMHQLFREYDEAFGRLADSPYAQSPEWYERMEQRRQARQRDKGRSSSDSPEEDTASRRVPRDEVAGA